MKVYLAGCGYSPWIDDNFTDFYRLESFSYVKPNSAENYNRYKDFILDSGIFSFLNGRETKNVDWEKYVDQYATFVREKNIKNYVEVDIDRIIGIKDTENLRKLLEKKVGWRSIPVWHICRGYDKWLEIIKDYDYVCFGAFLTDGLPKNKFHLIKKFLCDAEKEHCKVHGLGFTSFEWLPKLKFYSVDSSSWNIGLRYGSVALFDRDRVRNITRPTSSHKIKDLRALARNNFYEWIKFVKYADMKL